MREALALVPKVGEKVGHRAPEPGHLPQSLRIGRADALTEHRIGEPARLEYAERPRRVGLEVVQVAKHLTEPCNRDRDVLLVAVAYHPSPLPLAVVVNRAALGVGGFQVSNL